MKKPLVFAPCLMLSGCGEQSAQTAIENSGFTNVKLGGIPWWGCDAHSDSIFYNTKFTATARNGKSVTGVACGGLLKGWTVRLN